MGDPGPSRRSHRECVEDPRLRQAHRVSADGRDVEGCAHDVDQGGKASKRSMSRTMYTNWRLMVIRTSRAALQGRAELLSLVEAQIFAAIPCRSHRQGERVRYLLHFLRHYPHREPVAALRWARIFPFYQRGLRESTEPHRRATRPKLGSEWPLVSVWANLARFGSVPFSYCISTLCR